jgi:hypothetical protein
MPNQHKWADYVRIGTVRKPHKLHGQWEEAYAQFRCPYLCNEPVELPESNVVNNKSTECMKHLMACTGASTDGAKAEDDPRVREARKAAAECAVHRKKAKRGRADGAALAADATLSLRRELAAKTAECTTLAASESRLAVRNGELTGRVHSLEAQVAELRREMEQMRIRMQQRDGWEKQISEALGICAPPTPAIGACVDRIAGLKKAAAAAKAETGGVSSAAELVWEKRFMETPPTTPDKSQSMATGHISPLLLSACG